MSIPGSPDLHHAPRRAAPFVLAAVVLFPLVPWLMVGSLEDRFSGDATLKSVANLAAFFAVAAWAANLVLASRVRPIERAVGGLEQLYVLHRRVGVIVVVLAVIHAVFLTLHAGGSALDLYLPSAGWSMFSGVVAIVLLIGFVVASLVGRLSYQTFVLVQRLLGAAFVLGAFHAIAVRGTAASSLALTIYLACLTAAGVASLGYRLIGARLGVGRHRYRVDAVRRLADDAVEIVMEPVARPLEFQAGQFVYATFHQDGIPRESHPFTIASAPAGRAADRRQTIRRLHRPRDAPASGCRGTAGRTLRELPPERRFGARADLDRRRHRHHAVPELGPQSGRLDRRSISTTAHRERNKRTSSTSSSTSPIATRDFA